MPVRIRSLTLGFGATALTLACAVALAGNHRAADDGGASTPAAVGYIGALATLDRLDRHRRGACKVQLRTESRLSRDRVDRALSRLCREGVIEPTPIAVGIGNGGHRTETGYRRRAGE